MAEEEVLDDIVEEQEADETAQQKSKKKQQQQQKKGKKPCNQRIDELSTPNKRQFLALYNDHAHHLTRDKIEFLKALLQQLYAMTPEESIRYFAQRRAEAQAAIKRKRFKHTVRAYLLKKRWQRQRECGLKICKKVIKKGIAYAVKTPIPPIVSERLRILSDIILEHLAGILNIYPPCRCGPDKVGTILIATADWMAALIERLYYQTYVSKMENMQTVQNFDQTTEFTFKPTVKKLETSAFNKSQDSKYFSSQAPTMLSPTGGRSPRASRLSKVPSPSHFGPPIGESTPRQSINMQKNMSKTSAKKASKQSVIKNTNK